MKNIYINIEDYQNGAFAVGETLTAEGWKEKALSWCDSDGAEELYNYYENFDISTKGKELELIQDINEV